MAVAPSRHQKKTSEYSVSVIVPARDEAGTIANLVSRVPVMGLRTEILFVEGFSKDSTWKEIQKQVKGQQRKGITVHGYRQTHKKGKKAAVEIGFSHATGDILVILDSDLSVAPEELPRFIAPLMRGKADFANGSRFILPQEEKAMRFLNTIGNRCFAILFTLLLKQKITDTLCGTKALFRSDWKRIRKVTHIFSSHDPYGDFQLFLGAGLLKLRIIEIPVKYYARVYGSTKISRFRDGLRLLIIVVRVAMHLLF